MSQGQIAKACVIAAALGVLSASPIAMAQSPEPAMVARVHFPTDGSTVNAADQDVIRGVAARMQGDPTLVATVIGRTDTVGSAAYNEKLSQRRAEAVFEALVYKNHVPENRVVLKWTGERQPSTSNEDEKENPANRVAEIILAQGQMGVPARQYCVIVHISLANVTYLPTGSSLNDCAILAQGLEQQPPHLGQGTMYELGCQFGDMFMVTEPKSWSNRQMVSGDWLKARPDAGQENALRCADAWHVPH